MYLSKAIHMCVMLEQCFPSLLIQQQQSGSTSTPNTTASTPAGSSTTTTSSSTSSSSTSSSTEPVMTDDVFASLVQGISGIVTRTALGQGPPETIANFLSGLGESHQIVPGEGKCSYENLKPNFSFIDMFYQHEENKTVNKINELDLDMQSRVLFVFIRGYKYIVFELFLFFQVSFMMFSMWRPTT